jgi:hypothetical protein
MQKLKLQNERGKIKILKQNENEYISAFSCKAKPIQNPNEMGVYKCQSSVVVIVPPCIDLFKNGQRPSSNATDEAVCGNVSVRSVSVRRTDAHVTIVLPLCLVKISSLTLSLNFSLLVNLSILRRMLGNGTRNVKNPLSFLIVERRHTYSTLSERHLTLTPRTAPEWSVESLYFRLH